MSTESVPRTTTALDLVTAPLLADYLDAYKANLEGKGRRPKGVASYMLRLKRALGTMTQQLGSAPTVADVTEDAIEALRNTRMQEVAAATTRLELGVVRSFCQFLVRRRVLAEDPTRFVDYPKKLERLPRALSRAQLRTLWTALADRTEETANQRWQRERNRRVIILMLYAGLRLGEVRALCWRDSDLESGILTVRQGKGGKDRSIPLHPTLAAELRKPLTPPPYIRLVSIGPETPVIELREGEPMSEGAVSHIFDRWLQRRGLDISAHALRHSFASELLRAGAPLPDIQALLGHADLDTTSIYLLVNPEHLRQGIDMLPAGW